MTLPQLRQRTRYWCEVLELSDQVFVRWARRGEIPASYAEVLPLPEHGAAEVVTHKGQPYLEFWLVHELIHLVLRCSHLASHPKNAEERAINQMARALCTLAEVECPPKNYLIKNAV